jgi:hypothetical protein
MTTLETIIKGGTVDAYKYHARMKSQTSMVATEITSIKDKMKRKKPIEYFKGLVPSLVDHGYLMQITTKSKHEYAVSRKKRSCYFLRCFLSSIFFSQPRILAFEH